MNVKEAQKRDRTAKNKGYDSHLDRFDKDSIYRNQCLAVNYPRDQWDAFQRNVPLAAALRPRTREETPGTAAAAGASPGEEADTGASLGSSEA